MHLHELAERLRSSSLYVFTTRDLAKIASVSHSSAAVYVHRMKESGLAFPIEKGKFSVSEDPFVVATQLAYPSYMSFSSALYMHGRLDQVVNSLIVVTSRGRAKAQFMGMTIEFVKLSPERVFGYRKVEKGDSYVFLADLEKAVVDSLYMPRRCPVSQALAALEDAFDQNLLEEYAKRMGSEAVVRRTGYVLEKLGRKTQLVPTTKTPYKLNPSIRASGKWMAKWGLYVNEVVE